MPSLAEKFCDFVIGCQFIEEQLRKGILFCANEIKLSLAESNKKVKYEISKKELDNLSMGGLLKRFQRFVENQKLIKKLDNLVTIRNEVVHKEFLYLIERKKEAGYLKKRKYKLNHALKLADNCFEELTELILSFK